MTASFLHNLYNPFAYRPEISMNVKIRKAQHIDAKSLQDLRSLRIMLEAPFIIMLTSV